MSLVPQLLLNSLITASIYAFAGVSLTLTYGLLRVFNFAHGHVMMLGAYLFFSLKYQVNLGFFESMGGTLVLAIPLTFCVDRCFIQPFLRFSPLVVFIATLTLGIAIEAIVSLYFGVDVKSLGYELRLESFGLYGVFITPVQAIILVTAVTLLPVLAIVIHSTPFGRRLRAVAFDACAAESLHIPHHLLLFSTLVISTVFAFLAGIMLGYETSLFPTMGYTFTVKAFATFVLGGLGSIWGTIAGSLVLGLVENFSIGMDFFGFSLPAGYRDAFSFVVILGALLWRPQGLVGVLKRGS
jgi:branched-subunit amino acid ABC-type transport system permease component